MRVAGRYCQYFLEVYIVISRCAGLALSPHHNMFHHRRRVASSHRKPAFPGVTGVRNLPDTKNREVSSLALATKGRVISARS